MFQNVKTEDGSTSFLNEQFNECYHSQVGAYTEALKKHVEACQIVRLAKESKRLRLLDVCFGLAYNSGVAIQEALKANPAIKLEIIALENDLNIIHKIKELEVPPEYQSMQAHLVEAFEKASIQEHLPGQKIHIIEEKYDLQLLVADAREVLHLIPNDWADAVFFDPFSPKVCPELWQADFIRKIVEKAKPGAYISTYSSARIAKDNFQEAGCELFEGPRLNRRSGGVLARKC